ncbi:FAD-dependent monooxygenase [Kitasatospora sp. CM 4170]|uniref:FAD-dependent monooxygenase n=1 Tax=Kitasatospora aburaviensis TaxID=67265 RepID=A0ABW1EQE4_9ACTN|nr:FAD-dependent monooxygenase [Kitasatospora sp. CM 4170]WNM44414.1 FAD-dependent monooxygenase [Kitasatospora sp. CM 4170]
MEYDVVVAGSGPVGLMLAAELRLAGVRVLVVERLTEPAGHDRAGVLHSRTVEYLDMRGLLERFKDGMPTVSGLPFGGIFSRGLDHTLVETRHPYSLLVPQSRTEELLAEHAAALDTEVRRGHELTGLAQDADGVTVTLATPDGERRVRARYLVGCDGGRSTVRRLAGIGFPGFAPSVSALIGYVTLTERNVPKRWQRTGNGVVVLAFPPEGGIGRVVVIEYGRPHPPAGEPVTLEELRTAAHRVYGRELDLVEPVLWMSRFSDATRLAESYRSGRVLLAGDAAHIHFPIGGQGLNTGVHDAVNLGWKLAAEIHGWAPPGLLDSYHRERHRAVERVLLYTRAQLALMNPDEHHVTALREVFEELLFLEDTNRHLTATLNGLDLRYGDEEGPDGGAAADGGTGGGDGDGGAARRHPLVGRFAPDLELEADGLTTRPTELLRRGRGVLVDLTADGAPARAAAPWRGRIDVTAARAPQGGAPAALLVRPDGHVAWAAEPGAAATDGLTAALARWFGPQDWR